MHGCLCARTHLPFLDFLADNGHGTADVVPFNYFYSRDHVEKFARERNFSVVDNLRVGLVPSCLAQLQHHLANTCPSSNTKLLWARSQNVVCLTSQCSFYQAESGPVQVQEMRGALYPSDMFKVAVSLALKKLKQMHNTTGYISVHVRTESDFQRACQKWPIRDGKICWASESDIAKYLMTKVKAGSLIFVASGTKSSNLTTLCHHFTCITRAMLIADSDLGRFISIKRTSIAFLDWLLAVEGTKFFGNSYSSFSHELMAEFRGRNNHEAYFYNTVQKRKP